MPSKETLSHVSKNCLHGKSLPKPLALLWDAVENGDEFITDVVGISLLTSLVALNSGYGEDIAKESEDIAANVRAHQAVFARLGFFASDNDGGFLAFDQKTARQDDPPVVSLDSEGQYSWLGINLSEALFRKAEEMEEKDRAAAWLNQHGMPVSDHGEFGASTQFLPDIQNLQTRLYWQGVRQPRLTLPTPETAALPHDPQTWLLRPGIEVQDAIATLLNKPVDSVPKKSWVQCDGDGRVCTIWLHRSPQTLSLKIRGWGFGNSEAEIREAFGKPTSERSGWIRYEETGLATRFGFDKAGKVNDITLMDVTLN